MCSSKNASVLKEPIEIQFIVQVRNAFKSYKNNGENFNVLRGLNMSVKKNSIYALIGASGVGKTTLIKSLIGIENLNQGTIELFGQPPTTNYKLIGYMPQELAIIQKFTAREILNFFGILYGVDADKIKEKIEFLCKLLELPDENKFIMDCSGGEKRRISFACALIHDPKLLILDEPTVGVDPLLRSKLWEYFKKLIATNETTVIISTQYVQEAINATCIGFIRKGVMLIEENPKNILQNLNVETLDEAFFSLASIKSEQREITQIYTENRTDKLQIPTKFSWSRFCALLFKNHVHQKRSFTMFLFACLMPVNLLLCIHFMGRHPKDLKFGIVNFGDTRLDLDCSVLKVTFEDSHNEFEEPKCVLPDLSCHFIGELREKFVIENFNNSVEQARNEVLRGKLHGFAIIGTKFSSHIQDRLNSGIDLNDKISDDDLISVFLDQTNYQLMKFMESSLYTAYDNLIENIIKICRKRYNTQVLPIRIESMYGKLTDEFRKTMSIGSIVAVCFLFASSLSGAAFIEDKAEGIWDRVITAGARPSEIVSSHILSSLSIISIQVVLYFVFILYMFVDETSKNNVLIILMLFLIAICGLIFGLFISSLTKSVVVVSICTSSLLLPSLVISGILWPLEGIVLYLKYLSYFMPFTLPVLAMNGIIYKGFTFLHPIVALAVLLLVVYIILCLIVIVKRLNNRK